MTFSRVRTFLVACVMSVVVTLALGFGFAAIQTSLFPLPPGARIDNPMSTAAAVAAMPLVAKLLLLIEWSLTDLAAAFVAIAVNDWRKAIAWAAWIYPLLATVANYSEYPYPTWLMIAGAAACPLAAFAAYRLVKAYQARPPAEASDTSARTIWEPSPILIHACWTGVLAVILPAVWFLWLPRDEQIGALIFKGLLLLAGGYAALMNGAELIGAGVAWIADPSTAHDDSEQPNGERLFRVSRWRETVMALGCAGIVGVFVWISATMNPVFAIGAVAFALWTFVLGMQALFPGHLRLTASGFEAKAWTAPLEQVAWADIQPLYVQGGDRAGFVCYRYLDGRAPAHLDWVGRFYRAVGVGDGRVPGSLYLAPGPLCALMNEMRARAAGASEAAVSPPPSPAPAAPPRRQPAPTRRQPPATP